VAAASAAQWLVADPVAGAGPSGGGAIARIREMTAIEREAAATDALGESEFEPLKLGDSLIDPRPPRARELGPVAARGGAVGRELGQFRANLLKRQAYALREDDESDPPKYRPREATVARARSLGRDEAALLVEAKCGCGNAAPPGDLSNGQQLGHQSSRPQRQINFKFTSTFSLAAWEGPLGGPDEFSRSRRLDNENQ
jgi:hypothetical protein